MIYALNPKNYTKYTNYIIQNKKIKKTQEKIQKPNFKSFKLERFTNCKKNLNLKKNQINFVYIYIYIYFTFV